MGARSFNGLIPFVTKKIWFIHRAVFFFTLWLRTGLPIRTPLYIQWTRLSSPRRTLFQEVNIRKDFHRKNPITPRFDLDLYPGFLDKKNRWHALAWWT